MSLEVWGDEPEGDFLPDGCLSADEAEEIIGAVKDLSEEPLYEDGQMSKGVSVRFLMRLSVLRDLCGLMKEPHQQAVAREAWAALAEQK